MFTSTQLISSTYESYFITVRPQNGIRIEEVEFFRRYVVDILKPDGYHIVVEDAQKGVTCRHIHCIVMYAFNHPKPVPRRDNIIRAIRARVFPRKTKKIPHYLVRDRSEIGSAAINVRTVSSTKEDHWHVIGYHQKEDNHELVATNLGPHLLEVSKAYFIKHAPTPKQRKLTSIHNLTRNNFAPIMLEYGMEHSLTSGMDVLQAMAKDVNYNFSFLKTATQLRILDYRLDPLQHFPVFHTYEEL